MSITKLLAATLALMLWAGLANSTHIIPAMQNIPAGTFMMGSHLGDKANQPLHSVKVDAFRMGIYPVTVAEFRLFVQDTRIKLEANCKDHLDNNWLAAPTDVGTASWDKHRYQYSDFQPITCVSWQTANAYAKWLSEKTGDSYRLPTEQEWEYAAKGNRTSHYFWGDDANLNQACLYGNFADQSGEYWASHQYGASYVGFLEHTSCDDMEPYNSIVGLFRANPFGLHDISGNVSQWTSSCYSEHGYAVEENPPATDNCDYMVHRGGTWHYPPKPHYMRGRYKKDWTPDALMGFRLAADGHQFNEHASTKEFEHKLQEAQTTRIQSRTILPSHPSSVALHHLEGDKYRLSWQLTTTDAIEGVDIYRSASPYAHLRPGFYQNHYEKVASVDAQQTSTQVKVGSEGGSFRLVARQGVLSSLPSEAAVAVAPFTTQIPGKIAMQNTLGLHDLTLGKWAATATQPEQYFLFKTNKSFEQPQFSADYRIELTEDGSYQLNYAGRTFQQGYFMTLWLNDKKLIDIDFSQEDKTGNRHKVYLPKGKHSLQITSQRQGFDRWLLAWVEFKKVS